MRIEEIEQSKETLNFIERTRRVHVDGLYDYRIVTYIDDKSKVQIKCLRCRRIFEQSPEYHLSGLGCGPCNRGPYSRICREFLEIYDKLLKVEIQHADNKGEFVIKDGQIRHKVDGFFKMHGHEVVILFLGDSLHGNPEVYTGAEFKWSHPRMPGRTYECVYHEKTS